MYLIVKISNRAYQTSEKEKTMTEFTQPDTQTKLRGSHEQEFQVFLDCADDGNGNDIATGKPLKTFEEWMNS